MNLLEQATIEGVEGFLHCAELEQLADLARGREVLEVGAYCGLSAWGMAQTAKHVYSVDTFKACTNGQRQEEQFTTLEAFRKATARFNNVTEIIGTSEEAANSPVLEGKDFDFIFIDAMHTYEDCLADINRWWPRVRSGGVLACHDYGHGDFPGVKQAVDEVFGPAPDGTVCVTLRWIQK